MFKRIKKLIRKPLLKMLEWTEKTSVPIPVKVTGDLLRKDIKIPVPIIAIFTYLSLLLMISYELQLSFRGIIGFVIFICLAAVFVALYIKYFAPEFLEDDEGVMLTGLLVIFSIFATGAFKTQKLPFWIIPIPSVSILITLLVSPVISLLITVILSICMAILFDFSIYAFIFTMFCCLGSIFVTAKVRNRYDLVRVGYYIIFTGICVAISFGLVQNWAFKEYIKVILFCLANGIVSVMIVSAILPYFEKVFSKTTAIRILELGDFNQPLLKRLMLEAPGSYHHSLMVASLSESAAEAVNANPLLCRVGSYYHDIGKIAMPEYFIENQSGMPVKKSELKIQMSSFVIISHVKEGVRLANEYGIDSCIIDIIEQHHGTSLVHYFYIKALERGLAESEKSVYRYPGPRPRTKESAIIMLADAVEATSRTLKDPSYKRLQEMVHKIINNKFIDGQLDEVKLTLVDLNKIAERFANRLAGIYHSRIVYPEMPGQQKAGK